MIPSHFYCYLPLVRLIGEGVFWGCFVDSGMWENRGKKSNKTTHINHSIRQTLSQKSSELLFTLVKIETLFVILSLQVVTKGPQRSLRNSGTSPVKNPFGRDQNGKKGLRD